VRDEGDRTKQLSADDVHAIRAALEGLHEARARLEELLTTGSRPGLLELHAAVLSTVKRLLRELDLDERIRRQVRLRRPTSPRRAHRPAVTTSKRPTPPEPTPDTETQVLPTVPDDHQDTPPR
jgi:hypothetical protein